MKKFALILISYLILSPAFAQDDQHRSKKISLQHAGSIGYYSIGLSYHLPKVKSDISFHFGHVPKDYGGELYIGAVKYIYRPIKINISRSITFYPTNPGVFLSYHFGNDYHLLWPRDQYPQGYYWWSSGLREHISLNSELKFKLNCNKNKKAIKEVSFYTEFNTNDLYLYSYFANPEYFTLDKIVKLGFGVFLYL